MPDPTSSSESLEARLLLLERRLNRLTRLLALSVLLLTLLLGVLLRQQRRVLVTDSLFASQITIPRAFVSSASAGIAPATDGSSVTLWLSSSLFPPNREVRIDVSRSGEQSLRFYDIHGKVRLSLGLAADGTPQVSMQDPKGNVTWSADPLHAGQR